LATGEGVFFERGRPVRITVAHNRRKEEVMQSVDRSFNQLLQGPGLPQVKLADQSRSWQGNTLTFSVTAKMGLFSTPIKGTVEVTDKDITIDADLGMLERLIPAAKAREVISSRIKDLLN
jgi:Putative polyhydroxyalkanoic acid system protein (PHA_gran_rgn)